MDLTGNLSSLSVTYIYINRSYVHPSAYAYFATTTVVYVTRASIIIKRGRIKPYGSYKQLNNEQL